LFSYVPATPASVSARRAERSDEVDLNDFPERVVTPYRPVLTSHRILAKDTRSSREIKCFA
jgi:hypothetical protein